ncbi:Ubiquitin carboxyl-terminal hydrolase 21 [Madurella mycetomatis]|uniref:ubiquitinyl hydrolase 1 n=1 Tax=Madurella mycetomatis TaxID=100816 RepID=A0A175VQX8_9PEZI|nr:Ubiquitin carboxyl-terminal hydrolase 21 [Madurella mycetomatis]KXX74156.1 Ubiquitin carboxyl-terminal hydrolase 21 [Madurella mycetomatis]
MMVDAPEEHVVEPNGTETEDVAVINPDSMETDTLLASDYEAMKEHVLPPLVEEPRILEDQVHTWTVEGWRSLNKKEHGPIFKAGGYPWRILLFPHGNNVLDQCSIYLEHGFEANSVPEDWSCCVQFALVLWNRNHPSIFYHHSAHHRFTKEESDWGFTRFLEARKMFNNIWENAERPLVENDSANISAYVRIVEDETGVLWHNFNNYDSKKETGYVGLKNQGATCYLNSLLQSLYFTNAFRKAIYRIPTEHDENMSNSAYTLQRLFYQLQTSTTAVWTNELTKSFGWETRHIFEQQDVQELSRKLMERMEEKMKGTDFEKALPQLFSGKIKTYISCINVPYESSRVEDFWDVQLNVSGNENLLDSFQDYIQVEKLDGENQYFAGDQYKLQDANKGVIFMSFPDVLHLQLKRFEYDIQRDAMMKINDRYEFPEEFDASLYLDKEADRSEPWEYQLHGVLVHSGDLNAGHYYAFLKPNKEGWWYKYDDDRVTKATKREVLEENFGGPFKLPNGQLRTLSQKKGPVMRPNSAYMLVYIRKSRLDQVLCPVTKEDTPEHLQLRFEEEIAAREARRKEREEQHLYLGVKAITEATFQQHGGTDLTNFEAVPDQDPAAPRFYRLLRTATMQDLVNQIAADIEQDPKRVRLWIMVNRQNKTIRPDQPVMDLRPTVEETYARAAAHRDQALRVWVEVAEEVNSEGVAVWPTYPGLPNGVVVKNDLILLFLKWFDVESQSLKGVGHVYISKEKKVEELVPIIMKKMGWGEKLPSDEKIQLWEEIKPNMIEGLKGKNSLKAAELQDGDIVCFQRIHERKSRLGLGDKQSSEEGIKSGDRFEDAREYYDFLLNKRTVGFHPHPQKCDAETYPAFQMVLNSRISYDRLSEKIGERLGVEPTHLRFYTVNASSGNPRNAVKRGQNQTLHSILVPAGYGQLNMNQRNDELFFEVLDMSLAELDTKKSIKLTLLSEGITKEEQFDILVTKSGQVEDLIECLIKKANIPSEDEAGRIRIYETSNHKFFRELERNYPVISINDYTSVIAERIPPEDAEVKDQTHFISVFHFQGEPSRPHGVPFRFLLKEGETFAETKKRLEKRTGLKGKSFEKIKFAVVRRAQFSRPQYLADDDILWDVAANPDDCLGLDHPDRTRSLRNGVGDLFLKG